MPLRPLPRHVLALATAVILLGSLALPAALASNDKPPPLPDCFKTGSGYGSCEGMVIPGGGSVTKVETANAGKDRFTFTGPAPLQSTTPVACGDAGCVYNHLDWTVGNGATVVSHCQTNDTVCTVKVPRRVPMWAVVYVRQNNDEKQLWAIWNSGKADYEVSGDLRTACEGHDSCSASSSLPIADAPIKISGHKTVRTTTNDKGQWSVKVPNGSYVASPGLGGGYSVTPMEKHVKVEDHDEPGVDFTACGAEALAAGRAAVRAAAVRHYFGGSCFNGVSVYYAAGARTMKVTWTYHEVCGGALRETTELARVFKDTELPRGGTDSVEPASRGGVVAKTAGPDGKPMLTIVINSGGKTGRAETSSSSSDVHHQIIVNPAGLGREAVDCHPQAEELSLKLK